MSGCPVRVASTTTRPSTRPTRSASYARLRSRGAGRLDRRARRLLGAHRLRRRSSRRRATTRCSPPARSEHGGDGLNNVIPKAPVRLHIPVELDLPSTAPTASSSTRSPRRPRSREVQPMIQRWTTWFIDQVIEGGECDLASVIGVPAVVTLDWLGLDVDDWRALLAGPALRARRLAGQPGAHPCRRGGHPVDGGADRRRHRRPPGGAARRPDHPPAGPGGRRRADHATTRAYSMVELLISGGVGTTASLVSQTLVHLSTPSRPAAPAGRAPRAARARGRGVPAGLLADPGAGPHGHAGHRVPWLPDEGG